MKVEHAYKRDAKGEALTHDITEIVFASLRPVTFSGKKYPNGGWLIKDRPKASFTPPEMKEKTKDELPKGKVSVSNSTKELIAIIETEGLGIDTQQPRGELIKKINEVRG